MTSLKIRNFYFQRFIEKIKKTKFFISKIFYNSPIYGKLNLEELKMIQEKINSPTAMYGYYNLLGMVTLMEGKSDEALRYFEKGNPNDIYFLYFKALALKSIGDKIGARQILTDIANTNFSYWQLAIMKSRAKTMLESA